jgi:hypothetical protein
LVVDDTMKSEYQRGRQTGPSDKSPKILTHLMPVDKSWVDSERLQLLIEVGAEVTRVFEAVAYSQRAFLEPFVSSCVVSRAAASKRGDECLAMFIKGLMNSLYGKHGQRKRNLQTFAFKRNYEDVRKYDVPRDDFDSCDKVRDVYLMTNCKKNVVLDTALLVGSAILERSKAHMQRCFYDLCMAYPEGAVRLMCSDTDSFIFEVQTDDYYRDLQRQDPEMKSWRARLDLSAYSKFPDWRASLADHSSIAMDTEPRRRLVAELRSTAMVPGLLKDEMISKKGAVAYMTEIIALRSKCYSYDEEKDGVVSLGGARCKGVSLKKYKVRRPLTRLYRDVLETQIAAQKYKGDAIRCRDLSLHTVPVSKASITPHDDKFWIDESLEKLPYGYKSIEK